MATERQSLRQYDHCVIGCCTITKITRMRCGTAKVQASAKWIYGLGADSLLAGWRRGSQGHPNLPKAPTPASEERGDKRMESGDQLATRLEPRFTFQRFVVGKPNEFAYACARRVSERPAADGFNRLFLYGGVGLGKRT
jgi:chromosomal replication initiation ATPase DnaA